MPLGVETPLIEREIHLEKISCLINAAVATDSAQKTLYLLRRPCEAVCVVGRRLQSYYSDADSLGLFKALGYCAEGGSHVGHGHVERHMGMMRYRLACGGDYYMETWNVS